MLKRIDAGEAHGIVAWHPDRLSRNELDAAAITYRIRTGAIRDLKFGSYTFDNSPEGMMMLQLTMSQSQYFSSKLSKDVKRGNEKKLKLGWKTGWAPTGYLNTPDLSKGQKIIVNDPERFQLVRQMWDLMLAGTYSVPDILTIATNDWGFTTKQTKSKGGGPLSRSALYGIFTNPFYAGLIRHNGELYQGSHEPMVSLNEYDRAQQLLGRKGKPRPKAHLFTYRGLMTCGECGCSITAETKSKLIRSTGKKRFYTYYHCTRKRPCSQRRSISEVELEKQAADILSRITIIPEFKDWALKALRTMHAQETADRTAVQRTQTNAIRAVQKRLDGLTDMRLRELIDDGEFIAKREQLAAELRRLKEQHEDTDRRAARWLELTEQAFDFATTASGIFEKGTEEQRRKVFSNLGGALKLEGQRLEIKLHPWLQPIEESYTEIERAFNEVRTAKFGSSKEKTAALATVHSSWLRGKDSNLRPSG
jgi:site-specific DNA recombinase